MANRDLRLSLKILGDASDAIRALRDTNREARGLEGQVKGLAKQAIQLGALTEQASQVGTALESARAQVRSLRESVASATPKDSGYDVLTKALKAATREAGQLERSEGRLQERIGSLSTSLRAAGVDTARLAEEQLRLGRATDEASARARRAAANVRRAEEAGSSEAAAGSTGLPSIVGGTRTVIGIAAGLQAINLARSAVANAADLDGLNRQLEAVFGSTGRASREFEFARSEASRLGLELQSTARSYAQFSAATLGTRLEGEKTRDIFSAVNEAAARLGLSTDQTAGALTALQQIASKGTVQSEELRGQLAERLPNAFQIAARAMGVTTAELGKMLEQGEVVSDEFLPKFAAELRRSLNTDSETRIESLRSGFARLRSEGGLFAAEFFEPIASGASGAADVIAGLFKQLNDYTREAKNNLEDLGNGIVRSRSTGALFEQRRSGLVPVGQVDPRDPGAATRVTRGDIRNVIPLAPRPILPDITGLVPKPGALPDFGPGFGAQFEAQAETKKTAELREQLALVGARTELEKALYAITKGDQRNAGNTEKNLLIELAKARDAIRSEKAAAPSSPKAPKVAAADQTEQRALEEREALKRRLSIDTLRAQGRDQEAALLELRDKYQIWLKQLAGDAQGTQLADQMFDAESFGLQLAELRAKADAALSTFRAVQAAAAAGVQVGTVTPREAQLSVAGSAQQTIATLKASRAEVQKLLNDTPGDGRLIGSLAAIDQGIADLVQNSRSPFAQFLAQWEATTAGMQAAATGFLDSTADGIASLVTGGKFQFGDLLKSFAKDIVSSQLKGLFAELFKGISSGGAGGGIFAAIGSAFGFADGGLVRGPGSGTSDSIPARLSNGEYVIKAASVRQVGTRFLDALNGKTMPGSMRAGVPAFASGGLVGQVGFRSAQSGSSSAPTVHVPISINVPESTSREDSERIARETARAAEAAVQQVLANEMRPGGMLATR